MAEKVVISYIDDLDGGQADETVRFSLDGKDWEIDLSEANAAELRKYMDDYTTVARHPSAAKAKSGSAGVRRPSMVRDRSRAIREWAREQGFDVSSRGRIQAKLVEEYDRTHA